MIERLGLATVGDIEAALDDLAAFVEFPQTPDLATSIGARLRTSSPYGATAPPAEPVSIATRRPVVRSLRRSLLLAATIALLVVGVALGVRLGLDLLEIDFGPLPSLSAAPSAGASPSSHREPSPSIDAGARLSLGLRSSLDEASATAGFPLLVPADLGPPDDVFVGGTALRGQVAFGYRPRPDLPADDRLAGLGLLITQNEGRLDQGLVRKLVNMGTGVVISLDVDGAPGVWVAGEPHMFWYLDPQGGVIQGSEREVGSTLAWQRDSVLYRIEGASTMEQALEIARSMRAP